MEPITKDNLIDEHQKLVKAIYEYDYFVSTFERAQATYMLDMSDKYQIRGFWHHFWYMLPSTPSIQRDPFNRICDMAEGSYLYDE